MILDSNQGLSQFLSKLLWIYYLIPEYDRRSSTAAREGVTMFCLALLPGLALRVSLYEYQTNFISVY